MSVLDDIMRRCARRRRDDVLYLPVPVFEELVADLRRLHGVDASGGGVRLFCVNGVEVRSYPPLPIRVWGAA